MLEISVRTNVKELEKKLNDFAYRQIPFATAQALTSLGRIVQAEEKKALSSVFDRPTPFTQNAIGVIPARKETPQATVFMKDITASYLAPYEFGGKNKLNTKALLKPVDQPVNEFGNLPRKTLQSLKGKRDVFVGTVKTKSGEEINGVWQRPRTGKQLLTKAGKVRRLAKSANTSGHLKLLIRFTEPHDAKQHLDWFKRAEALVRANFDREMGKALARAIASAK